ncbi:MAG: hypothetical protein WCI77_02885 [Candidatus Omnitrophota bacterium]
MTRYYLDIDNRFVIKKDRQKLYPRGKFVIDTQNKLSYIILEPISWRRKETVSKKITFEGTWSLDENHTVVFTLHHTRKQPEGGQFYFTSELIDTRSDALIFSLATKEQPGVSTIRLLQLQGRWQADQYNRLSFLVKKTGLQYDTLTFAAAWELDRNNTLVYTYKKTYLKTKERIEKTLVFKGFWQIGEKDRLCYALDIEQNSYFSFKVAYETPSILAKKGEIKYRLGVGVRGERLFRAKVITIYGVWKLSRKIGLSFEVDYGHGVREIVFGAQLELVKGNQVTFELTSQEGNSLGLRITFSKSFLRNNAQWFLRFSQRDKESRVEGGVDIAW